jgi:hypothetical protein
MNFYFTIFEEARNKEYASLFMKVHGVQGPSLRFFRAEDFRNETLI